MQNKSDLENPVELQTNSQSDLIDVYVVIATQKPYFFGGEHIFIILKKTYDQNLSCHFFINTDPSFNTQNPELSKKEVIQNLSGEWKTIIETLEKNGEFIKKSDGCFKELGFKYISLKISGNIFTIAKECKHFLENNPYDLFENNCADITAWFLEKYVNIPKISPCVLPLTCDRVGYGCWLPSFFQCVSLPGRLQKNIEYQKEKKLPLNPSAFTMT